MMNIEKAIEDMKFIIETFKTEELQEEEFAKALNKEIIYYTDIINNN
ncbi:MAG: hypothetical protein J6A04_04190 [Clostridia bacterium]|nr:hypothetical protein [Clostridia bacterium]